MGKPGHVSKKGVGELWGEAKTEKVLLALTPTGKNRLDEMVEMLKAQGDENISRSELVERFARGLFDLPEFSQEDRNNLGKP
ncbi:MAG TPA: hypothetical protein DCY88_04790 [Cyanobacteria bacterium UBA11372]|nr:hypothetical protein [Cyanobacteria bacterium UBA11372]